MLKIHYVKKIFIGLIAFSLISGSLLINNVYAGKGVKYKEIESNPIRNLQMLEENNVREKVLSNEEFQRLSFYSY